MTTRTYTSVVDHTGNAGYIAWRDQLFSELILCGLVQTADTGQYTAAAGTRPATNTAGDYIILRLSNSALYFKIETGTGSVAAGPQAWITVGTGSNGSGTITGQTNTRSIWMQGVAPTSTAVAYTTYLCVVTDAFSVVFKANGYVSSARHGGVLCVGRTADSSGSTTTTGFAVIRLNGTANALPMQWVRTDTTATTYSETTQFALVPGGVTSSALQNGDLQVYQTWIAVPDVQPFLYACVYVEAEVTELNTITATLFGSSSHTYLALSLLQSSGTVANGSTAYAIALIYE